tara:strand:- start:78 stop:191 length:114 start_codon:yes stop_codon:yes gene_type:complete
LTGPGNPKLASSVLVKAKHPEFSLGFGKALGWHDVCM